MEKQCDKYRMIYDYHTHTVFSHGKGSIEDNVKAAIKAGLSAVAITDHGSGHLTYGVKRSDIPFMRREVDRLKDVYPEIGIYLGIEANIVSVGKFLDVRQEELPYFDFIIAGYHYGIPKGYCVGNWLDAHGLMPETYGRKLQIKNTEVTVKALYENEIKILTHPGDKGRFDLEEIARACQDTHTLMEISTWHSHLTVEEIRAVAKYDVKFIISSDAHTPRRVGSFAQGVQRALAAGLDMDRIVNIGTA